MKKVGDFIKSFNSSMSGKSYYTDNVGEGNIINGTGATLSWGENIGGTGAWMGPLISQLYSNPELSENDIMYIENKLGLNEEREFKVKTGEDENGNPIYETVTATPKEHFRYAIPY